MRHPLHPASVKRFALGLTSVELRIAIGGHAIWSDVEGSRDAMIERLRESLSRKYGGGVSVQAHEGSLTLVIILAGIEAAKAIYEIVSSVHTLTEYVIRCVEQSRFDWPPVTAMFTFFEALKRLFLGV